MAHFCGKTHSARDRRRGFGEDEDQRVSVAGATSDAAVQWPAPTEEQIARLAYSYWEARGCTGGTPEADWFRAEAELRGR